MRIAIATDWFAPRRGGIERQLADLAGRLAHRGHEVDVLTTTPGASADSASFRVRALPVSTVPGIDVALSPSLPRVLRRALAQKYDVVHAHVSVVAPVGYTAAWVARSLDVPTVLTFHSILRGKRYLLRAVDIATGFGSSHVQWTAVSARVARQVGAALNTSAVSILPNGVDLAFWNRAATDRAVETDAPVTFVSTMRLHRKKRPVPLLRAFAAAAARSRTPMRLVVVGDGPERPAVERAVRALGLGGGTSRVELAGWLSHEALRDAYRSAHAFVIASKREAFGIAALEAAAAGLPVITMAETGSGGFLRPDVDALLCNDDDHLALAMARFAGDRELRLRLRNDGAQLSAYDWSAVTASHEAVYRRAISSTPSA